MDYVTPSDRTKPISIDTPGQALERLQLRIIDSFDDLDGTASLSAPSSLPRKAVSSTPTDKLYRLDSDVATEFQTALRLVGNARAFLSSSLDFLRNGDLLEADNELHKLMEILPELFCCRDLSDGFELIITSVQSAFFNMNGARWEEAQLIELRRLFEIIQTKPLLQFDIALPYVMRFEDSGINVDAPGIETLAELFSD